MMNRNPYVKPDPEDLIETGEYIIGTDKPAVKRSDKEQEGEGKAPSIEPRENLVKRFVTGAIKFSNDLDVSVYVFATAQEDTSNLYNAETAITGNVSQAVGLGYTRKLVVARVAEFNVEYEFELQPMNEVGSETEQKVPEGAEGLAFMWFLLIEGKLRFGGRLFIPTGHKIYFIDKPTVISDPDVPTLSEPGQVILE